MIGVVDMAGLNRGELAMKAKSMFVITVEPAFSSCPVVNRSTSPKQSQVPYDEVKFIYRRSHR